MKTSQGRRVMNKRNRENEIRLQIEEYRKKLRKMTLTQFAEEWYRVVIELSPQSAIRAAVEECTQKEE